MSTALFEYFPGNENEVYVLHGLLREEVENHLGLKFQFHEFEIGSRPEELGHYKDLDAIGSVIKNGTREEDVTFEYKTRSSNLRGNIEEYPNLEVDWLICWEDDARGIENYADNILALRDVYEDLADEKQEQIFENETSSPSKDETRSIEGLLLRFDEENRSKVEFLIENWTVVEPGQREIIFSELDGSKSLRACAYSTQHLVVKGHAVENVSLPDELKDKITGELKNNIKLMLDDLEKADLRQLLDVLSDG